MSSQSTLTLATVPNGRYAVAKPDAPDDYRFFHVNTPTEGRWAGYTFVKVQASDDVYPVKSRQWREAVLAMIAADVPTALAAYGQKLGTCGKCGRTLTDAESRALGIGPVCRANM